MKTGGPDPARVESPHHSETSTATTRTQPAPNSAGTTTTERSRKRLQVIEMLGSRCENCGNTDIRVLQIDHRFNDGHMLKRGGRIRGFNKTHFNRIIRGDDPIDRYQLLCANCHQLKNLGFI
jgi:hypothetical protein